MRKVVIATVVALFLAACNNITLISVSSSETQGNGDSAERPALSTNGQFVAFTSAATNLVPNDTNAKQDVFVRDVENGTTNRVSETLANGQANGDSANPSISDDGRYFAFSSTATNMVAGDTNNASDVFARDMTLGVTGLVSHDSANHPAAGKSIAMGISADGSKLLFVSNATNLEGATTTSTHMQLYLATSGTSTVTRVAAPATCSFNNKPGDIVAATMSGDGTKFGYIEQCPDIISISRHIFAKTSLAATPVEVGSVGDCEVTDVQCSIQALQYARNGSALMWVTFSASGRGEGGTVFLWPGNGSAQIVMDPATRGELDASDAAISPTGRYLAYVVSTFNEAPPNGDLRLLDRTANTTSDVSVATDGTSSFGFTPAFSPDGTQIGFLSGATNLVPNDTNGKVDVFMRPVTASAAATTAVSRSGASSGG